MPLQPNTPETSSNISVRGTAIAALAIAASLAVGWFGPDPLKGGAHQPESVGQINHALDGDWTRLADKMDNIAHNPRDPQLTVNRRRTDTTGGTGVGAVATVLTIKDGLYGQAGANRYGFSATVVEQSGDSQSTAVPPLSSFDINFYGNAPTGTPFNKLIDMSGGNLSPSDNFTRPNPSGFSFSMEKATAQSWLLGLQFDINAQAKTSTPYNQQEPIDPGVATSLVGQVSQAIVYLLNASNTPLESPIMPSSQS
jgi:hypothetical protein